MKFLPKTCYCIPQVLVCCIFFCLPQDISLSLWFLLTWKMLISMYLCIFQFSYSYLFPFSYYCSQRRYLVWFQSSWICHTSKRPKIRSLLGNAPCVLEKNVYSVAGWNVLYVRSNWSLVLFKYFFFLYWCSKWSIHCWVWGIKVLSYHCIAVYFCW